jgi:hypothetical protein
MMFLGMGPVKSVLLGSEYSDFGWFLIRFGLLGALFYVILLIKAITINLYGILNKKYGTGINIIFYGIFGVMVVWLVFCFSESIFKNPPLMNFILFSLAFGN